MKELFGVLGTGTAKKKAIYAALDDLGVKANEFVVPWYGKPTEGLEYVYDWLIDNEATFTIISSAKVPNILTTAAKEVTPSKNVNEYIIETLKYNDVTGMALLLWDDINNNESTRLAELCIDSKIPTLELTNGLVPIVFDEEREAEQEKALELTKEMVESMPPAVQKRASKKPATQESPVVGIPDRSIVKVVVHYSDGMIMEL